MRQLLIPAIVVLGLTTSTAFADKAKEDAWQKSVEECLKGTAAASCYVTEAMGVHCDGKIDESQSIRKSCVDKANANGAPKRREIQ